MVSRLWIKNLRKTEKESSWKTKSDGQEIISKIDWADWMIHKKGMKVYLRRDIKNYKVAWVFNAENDEFIGKAEAFKSVAALYAPEVSKEEFETAMATKKRNIKVAKSYIKQNKEISAMEKYKNYEAAYQSVEREYKKPVKVSRIANTSMDKAIQKNKDMENFGKADLSIFLPEKEKRNFIIGKQKSIWMNRKRNCIYMKPIELLPNNRKNGVTDK